MNEFAYNGFIEAENACAALCRACGARWGHPFEVGNFSRCPKCSSSQITDLFYCVMGRESFLKYRAKVERLEETQLVYRALEDIYALAVPLIFNESDGVVDEDTPVDDWDAFGREYVELFLGDEKAIAYFTADQLHDLETCTESLRSVPEFCGQVEEIIRENRIAREPLLTELDQKNSAFQQYLAYIRDLKTMRWKQTNYFLDFILQTKAIADHESRLCAAEKDLLLDTKTVEHLRGRTLIPLLVVKNLFWRAQRSLAEFDLSGYLKNFMVKIRSATDRAAQQLRCSRSKLFKKNSFKDQAGDKKDDFWTSDTDDYGYSCDDCGRKWGSRYVSEPFARCPDCGSARRSSDYHSIRW